MGRRRRVGLNHHPFGIKPNALTIFSFFFSFYNDTNLQENKDIIKIKTDQNTLRHFMNGVGQTQLPYTANTHK